MKLILLKILRWFIENNYKTKLIFPILSTAILRSYKFNFPPYLASEPVISEKFNFFRFKTVILLIQKIIKNIPTLCLSP
jgi:hypothetical protein